MKINKIILVSIFLLAIISLGAASASEDVNATASENVQNIAVEDNSPAADSLADEVVGDGESPKECNVTFPDSVKAMERNAVTVIVPEGAEGTLEWYFDGEFQNDDYFENGGTETFYFKFSSYGEHYLDVKFTSGDESICPSAEYHKDYNINDYVVDIIMDDDFTVYGQEAYVDFEFPDEADGIAEITVNGKKYTYDLSDESVEGITIPALNTTTIAVTVRYTGDSKYADKTFSREVYVDPDVYVKSHVSFNEQPVVSIRFFDELPVNIKVYKDIYGEMSLIHDVNVTTKDNSLDYAVPCTFEFDESYYVEVSYRDYKYENDIHIDAATNLDDKIWVNDNSTYWIEIPESYAGKNAKVELYDPYTGNYETLFEGILDNSTRISFKFNSPEEGEKFLYAYADDEEVYTRDIEFKKENPSFELNATADGVVVKNEAINVHIPTKEDTNGKVSFYIDGVFMESDSINDCDDYSISCEGIDVGNHTLSLVFSGDDYYKDTTQNFTFEIAEHILQVPKTVIVNGNYRDYTAFVRMDRDATGDIKFYLDGKLVETIDYQDWMEDDISTYVTYDLSEIDINRNHTLKIVYAGDANNKAFSESFNLATDFTIRIEFSDGYQYGISNDAYLYLPPNSKANFEIFIDGKKFTKYYDDDGVYRLDISEYAGTHSVLVVYKGDDTYAARNITVSFDVEAVIHYDAYVTYGSNYTAVTLDLPKDAKGNLIVNVDDENYANVSVVNGKAGVSFASLEMGQYNVHAYYDGSDYNVTELKEMVSIVGKIQSYVNGNLVKNIYSARILYGDEISFRLTLPKDAEGTLEVLIGDESYEADMVNGTAEVKIPLAGAGQHSLIARFTSDVYTVDNIDDYFTVAPRLLPISQMVAFGKNEVSLNASKDFKGYMEIVVDDDWDNVYKVSFKDGIATVSLSKLTAGAHTLEITSYENDEELGYDCVNVTVANAPTPRIIAANAVIYYMNGYYRVTVYGVDGKLLKNANVLFKINGKNLRYVRTDAYGRAILKVTNLPGNYRITAQYGKAAVTKILSVKRVLTFKNTIVKKSAKYAILQAALKKGKIAIRNQWVVFKFNGRTFKAKTNAYGIAKVAVKKAFFAKLPVGRKVIYQATYSKDTIRKVAIVRR